MFFYLIYNSTFLKNNLDKNKYVNTLIYGSIIYIIVHILIHLNKSMGDILLKYFWIFFLVDITSLYLSCDLDSEFKKINLYNDIKLILRKKNTIKNKEHPNKNQQNVINNKKESKNKETQDNKEILDNKHKIHEDTKNIFDDKNEIREDNKDILDNKNEIQEDNKDILNNKIQYNNKIKEDKKDDGSDCGSDIDIDLESFEKELLKD
tara:strand:+ start:86 stop:706 length:621 start_codon:yes stop_codon:yes gene_type:complete